MQTKLDDDMLNKVVGIVNDIYGTIGDSGDQDSLLIMTCLQLAYNLEMVSGHLRSLDSKLDAIEPLKTARNREN